MRWGASALSGSAADGAVCRFGRHGGGVDGYCMDIQYSADRNRHRSFSSGWQPLHGLLSLRPADASKLAEQLACIRHGLLVDRVPHAGWSIEKTELRCAMLNTTALPWLQANLRGVPYTSVLSHALRDRLHILGATRVEMVLDRSAWGGK